MDDKAKLAKNMAKFSAMQHEIVLDCIAYPDKYKPKKGYSMDAYGNPEYVDENGISHRLEPVLYYNEYLNEYFR